MLCAAGFSIFIRPAWICRYGSIFSATRWKRSAVRRANANQRRQLRGLDLVPVAEFRLVTETIRRFRTGYVAEFGAATPDDLLYEAVSEGRRYPGMEHWLPLFHNSIETIFDYLPDTPLALEHLAEDAAHERFTQIADYYDARREALKQGVTPPYKPLPPARLYFGEAEWKERLETSSLARLTPFAVPERRVLDVGARVAIISPPNAPSPAPMYSKRSARMCSHAGDRQTRCDRAVERRRARTHEPRARRSQTAQSYSSRQLAAGLAPSKSAVALAVLGIEIRVRDRGRRHRQRAGYSRRPTVRRAVRFAARRISSPRQRAWRQAIWSSTSITASAASSGCRRSRRQARRTIASKSITPGRQAVCRSKTSTCCRATARRKRQSNWIGSAAATGRRARRA